MKMKNYLWATLCMALFCPRTGAQTIDVQSDTWVCNDGLNRVVASSDRGVTRTKIDSTAQVGIFYYIWHGQHGAEVKDITRLLEKDPDNPAWGGEGQFHWGGKPALGYYAGGDKFIVAKHMQMLVDAGVDFYFFDVTNAFTYDAQVQVVMDEIDRRTKLGLKSPKLVFCTHSSTVQTVTSLYNKWYSQAKYDKYWWCWNGKPLILVNASEAKGLSEKIRSHFTMRHCWAWEEGEDKWPWLAYYPQQLNYSQETGKKVNEQMTVATAMHPCSKIGKSYHGGSQPSVNKYGVNTTNTPKGLFFQEQFSQAISRHPKVLMITQWNEWMAQRFIVDASSLGLTRPGAKQKVGETYFVDVYNQEFNRDIEPSSEPLIRDNYYLQMVSNLRKYRGVRDIPVPTEIKSIDMDGGFEQWADVQPEFLDEPGDVAYTSSTAQNSVCLKRRSNDFVSAKVAKDGEYIYFYAKVNGSRINTFYSNSTESWMSVLINTDLVYNNGWEGYEYTIAHEKTKYFLYKYDKGSASWEKGPEVQMAKEGTQIMYAVKRADLGLTEDVDFDFKWVDNTPGFTKEILDFIANGDCAPNGRFNYRYKGSKLDTPDAIKPLKEAIAQGTIRIYDTAGRLVSNVQGRLSADELQQINLPTGSYIAKQGKKKALKFQID